MGKLEALRRFLRALDHARRLYGRDRLAGAARALDAVLGLLEDLDPDDRRGHALMVAEVAARVAAAVPERRPDPRRTRGHEPVLVWIERAHIAACADRLVPLLGKPAALEAVFGLLRERGYRVRSATQVAEWRRAFAEGRAPEGAAEVHRRLLRGGAPLLAGEGPAAAASHLDRLAAALGTTRR